MTVSTPPPITQPPQQQVNDLWGVAAATVQSHTISVITTLINDLSSGSGSRPSKLLDMSKYYNWQKKFKIHLEGMGLEGGEAW